MNILAIETSCDEASVAIVDETMTALCNVTASMQKDFEELRGVIPEQAARKHIETLLPVLDTAGKQSGIPIKDIDAIAVTKGPGLQGSLLVGTVTARALASVWKTPLMGVHHTFGHLSSTFLERSLKEISFPIITLSASGGHTDLWYRESHTRGTLLGRTRDDAAGEAFDKGAAMLSLPYPGGPSMSKAAESGDNKAFSFPLPLQADSSFDFSFSGLKTALKYEIADIEKEGNTLPVSDLAASFQHAICRHLVRRVGEALQKYPDVQEVHLVGGVSANTHLRSLMENLCSDFTFRVPVKMQYCTDNAAMIAAGAHFLLQERGEEVYEGFETLASLSLKEVVC